jgi:hypothetical protein
VSLLDGATTVEELVDGQVRVQRAGIVGIGRSIAEATRDLAGKLALIGRMQQSSPD